MSLRGPVSQSGRFRRARRALLASLLTLTVIGSVLPTPIPAVAAGPTIVLKAPASAEVGEPVILRIEVVGARDVGGYEALLRFDPSAAEFAGVSHAGTDVSDAGRGIAALGPVERPDGTAFGFYSCPVADCSSNVGPRTTVGPSGRVRLATAQVVPLREGLLEIALGPASVVDTNGRAIATEDAPSVIVQVGRGTTANGRAAPQTKLQLVRGGARPGAAAPGEAPTDMTRDGRVTNADAREAAIEWNIARYDDTCEADFGDVNGDGCMSVGDVQAVADAYTAETAADTAEPEDGGGIVALAASPVDFVPTATWTVNTTADTADAVITDNICATAAGTCSLRAAIENANRHAGTDLIRFAIPGTGVQTIDLGSRLPTINDGTGGLFIDGYTQTGAVANTATLASNAVLRIAITGLGDSVEEPAFTITSPGNIIQGLSIYETWRKVWISGPNAADNLVAGSFIGTNPAATFVSPSFIGSAGGGIVIDSGAHDNQVGDRTLAGRNVISGTQRSGIQITQENTRANVVVNNIIGLSPDGTRRVQNLTHGVDLDLGSRQNVVGGTAALERNVISGNGNIGVEVAHLTTSNGNQIVGNFIGTDLTGNAGPGYARNTGEAGVHVDDGPPGTVITDNVIGNHANPGVIIDGQLTANTVVARNRIGVSLNGTPIPNGSAGVVITDGASGTTIGPDNIIANHPIGIQMNVERSNVSNRITRNSLFDNGVGIDLFPSGVNPNGQFGTLGPNRFQAFPGISSATTTTVTGQACAGCTVEVFLADGGDNEFGQGRTFVGSAVAVANPTGATTGRFTATVSGLAIGDFVTTTATDSAGNSSEFSLNRRVTATGLAAPGALLLRDTFDRFVTAAIGMSDRGGPWTTVTTPPSEYSTNGRAHLVSPAANVVRSVLLSSVSERDVDATVQVQTDKPAAGGNQFVYVVLRRHGNNEYRANLRFATNGQVFVQASRVLNNAEAMVSAAVQVPGITTGGTNRVWVRVQAVGASPTTIRIKVWADGALEPTAWTYTGTNSDAVLQAAGEVGIRTYVSTGTTNTPVTFSFEGFRVNAPAPVDAVAPAAPTGLIAAPGNNAAYLSWNASPEPDLVGYHVYRGTTSPVSITGAPLSGSEPLTSPSFVDTTAVNGITYRYVVRAVDASTNRSAASNEASATPDPSAGSALDFDGTNDYVTFGPAPSMGVTSFTIETWFRRDGPGVATATSGGTGGVTAIPLLTKGRSEDDGTTTDMNYFLGIRSSDNVLAADFEDNATGANHAVAGTTPITTGVWHHAAATYNGSTWRLYLDGVLDGTLNVGAFTPRSDSIQHGALATSIDSIGGTAGFFDGRLDEARVWNVVRSQTQIATARDLQLNTATGLIARWGLNEGAGNTVSNSAGAAAGSAVGGPLWVQGAPFAAGTDPAPNAPTGVAATPGPGRIDLGWTANSEADIAGYNVYRGGTLTGPTVSAVAAGDIASCSSTGDEATAALVDNLPGTVFVLGDNVYENGTITEFNNCYNPTWGRAKARTSPAAGNHEYQTANAAGYYSYFGAAAGTAGQGYYSYDYGTWHVIVLNSNCANVACAAGSAQEQWLRADLAANPEACTLAYWHHPRFSSGDSHGNDATMAPFWNALYEFNADLILTGHDHTYERFGPQTPGAAADPERGIRQFVVGSGGRSHNGFDAPEPNSQVRNGDTYGVLALDLKPGGYDWEFVPEAGRTFTDSGSDVCHDANGPVTNSAPVNGDTLVPGTSFSDTAVAAGTQYSYTVRAVDDAGHESGDSSVVTATPDVSTNNALDFDGTNDHATLGAAAAYNSNTFTVETWLRRDGAGVAAQTTSGAGGVTAIPLVTKGRSGTGTINWFLGIDSTTGRLAADFESGSDDSNHGITGTTALANGTWYHAAVTYDGTTFRLYLNGVQEASAAVANGPGTASNQPPALATAMDGAGAPAGFFNGVLDEVRIWNVARSAAQISAARDQELITGSGLLGRYGLNEGGGASLANSIAGGPAGAAVGGPQWVAGSPFSVPDPAPAAPTGLVASPGNGTVSLAWVANTEPDLAGYRVYRGTSSPVSIVGTPLNGATLLSSPAFADSTAVNGTSYFYVVTAVDDAGQQSQASNQVQATPAASGPGTALDFDGVDDHVTFGPAAGLGLTSFTIETWFRRDGTGVTTQTSGGTGGVTSVVPLVTKGASESDSPANLNMNYFLGLRTTDNVLVADFEDTVNGGNHAVTGVTPITSGVWHHAAVTYNTATDTWNLYLDGVLDRTLAIGDFTPESTSSQHGGLGTALNSTGVQAGRFDGALDEIRIWNGARSAAEIAAARDLQLTSGTGLVARWGLNEGAGGNVGNSVPGGVNGTTAGGPAWVPGAPFSGGGTDPAPEAPDGLVATPGNNQVGLSWNANTEQDLAGYNVYRDGAPAGPTVTASGAGDIAACSTSGDEATAALVATIPGDVLALGDTVYDNGTAAEYANCYQPSWGQFKTRTRPVVGNHEYGTANASGYFNYFGAAAGTQGQGYYSYDYGAWHVIVLNSMCANVGGCGTRLAADDVAPGGPRGERRVLHDGALAPPAHQLEPWRQHRHPAALPGALRRQCRPGPHGPRPHLRAVRADDGDAHGWTSTAASASSSSAPAGGATTPSTTRSRTAKSATTTHTA